MVLPVWSGERVKDVSSGMHIRYIVEADADVGLRKMLIQVVCSSVEAVLELSVFERECDLKLM